MERPAWRDKQPTPFTLRLAIFALNHGRPGSVSFGCTQRHLLSGSALSTWPRSVLSHAPGGVERRTDRFEQPERPGWSLKRQLTDNPTFQAVEIRSQKEPRDPVKVQGLN
jgi:hypothetical protein